MIFKGPFDPNHSMILSSYLGGMVLNCLTKKPPNLNRALRPICLSNFLIHIKILHFVSFNVYYFLLTGSQDLMGWKQPKEVIKSNPPTRAEPHNLEPFPHTISGPFFLSQHVHLTFLSIRTGQWLLLFLLFYQ